MSTILKCLWCNKRKLFWFFLFYIKLSKAVLLKWIFSWDQICSFTEEKSHILVGYVENPSLIPVLRGDTVSYTPAKSLFLARNAVCSLLVWTTWSLIWKFIARKSSFKKPALLPAAPRIRKSETFFSCSSINLPPLEGRKFNCWLQTRCIT